MEPLLPDDESRRRAAWGVYYANEHPWNVNGPVSTKTQTVYHADLMAICSALHAANQPTHIVLDCMAVVEQLRSIIYEREASKIEKGDYEETWEQIRTTVLQHPPEMFEISWVQSHTDVSEAAERESAGGFEEKHVRGNDFADALAKSAMSAHPIDWEEYDRADDRTFIAAVTQHLIKNIWTEFVQEDQDIKEAGDYEDELNTDREYEQEQPANKDEPNLEDLEWLDMQQRSWEQEENQSLEEEVNMHDLDNTNAKRARPEAKEGEETKLAELCTREAHGGKPRLETRERDESNTIDNLCTREARKGIPRPGAEEEHEQEDMSTTNNQEILRDLENNIPHYGWNNTQRRMIQGEDYDLIQIPKTSYKIGYNKRGTQHIQGRGKVSIAFCQTQYYLEPVRNWFNSPKWKPRCSETNEASNTTTMLECIVDFELSAGMRLEDIKAEKLSWSQKADRLSYYIKTLARTNTITWNGPTVTHRQALRPTPNAPSLTPLGAPLMAGYARKPLWNDERTPRASAINVWKARQETLAKFPAIGIVERRSRKFAKLWHLNLRGYRSTSKSSQERRQAKDKNINKQTTERTDTTIPQ